MLKIIIFFRPLLKRIKVYDFLYKRAMRKREGKFTYSEDWYNTVYHHGRLHLEAADFKTINELYEKRGYRARLEKALDQTALADREMLWLEVGCHLGLSAS